MKMVCFCGEESEAADGILYCRNPECPEYLNIAAPRDLTKLTKLVQLEADSEREGL